MTTFYDNRMPAALGQCGPYDREHSWGEWTSEEERGILVITHGKRTGRIYSVERSTRDRECSRCGAKDRRIIDGRGFEWPGNA